jgi:methylphosphotriester-DNA--protein-cysteine methyltransferase
MERVSVVRADDKALYKPPVDPVLVEIPEFDFATPHQWLTSQRLMMAQELLERTDRGVEQVAADCGLTPLMLRRHFAQRWGITPQAYRRRFSQLAS